jgi:F0F1-type ATP synthase delta subunit
LKKIYEQAEKIIREKTGKRKLVVEVARKAKGLDAAVRKIAKKSDIVEEKINPDLIAGIKITINDEMQFDGSMSRKIKKLFSE